MMNGIFFLTQKAQNNIETVCENLYILWQFISFKWLFLSNQQPVFQCYFNI